MRGGGKGSAIRFRVTPRCQVCAMVRTWGGGDLNYSAFEEIDATWGSFDNYVAQGLQLSATDIQKLRDTLLE